jgi:hypothetical protein
MKLVQFYRNEIRNDEGYTIEEVMKWGRFQWEASHLSIQWIFPTVKPSQFNPGAPTLDEETIEVFKTDPDIRIKFHEVLIGWLGVYGVNFQPTGPTSPPLLEWQEATEDRDPKEWLEEFNHNHLRITRILECLRHLGFDNYAVALFHKLTEVQITQNTYQFWRKAVYG